jgi:hypothetical protein
MNPYASFLGSRDAREVIAATPARLRGLIDQLGAARGDESPRPGKWSARQIICHLADTEIVFAYRMRQALAEDHHVIQPFDQERWAENYRAYALADALALFSGVRKWNVALIEHLPPEAFSKRLTHPERGEMTFRVLVETMAGHDLNHIGQVEAIAGRHTAQAG